MKLALLLGFLAIPFVAVLAQEPAVSEAISVNLVELDVRAIDLNGRIIKGLSPEDFVVRENGRVQEIEGFEEVDPAKRTEADLENAPTRIMLLLDLRNSSYPLIHKAFPQLRDFIQQHWDGRSELGLALNSNGILELISFTRNQEKLFQALEKAEKFFRENKFRSYGRAGSPGFSSEVVNQLYPQSSQTGIYQGFISNYYRREVDTLGQFVRYLGSWSGKKNLILISESWGTGGAIESDVDLRDSFSLRDIQTICIFNKVSINAVDIARSRDYYGDGSMGSMKAGTFFQSSSASLASSTAGYFFKSTSRDIAPSVARAVAKTEHFYRLRYYTTSKGKRYRNIKVALKGLGRVAMGPGGYYPRRPEMLAMETPKHQSSKIDITMDTDWMYWGRTGWKKRRATYAVIRRAYDENGLMVKEQVFTGELLKRKQDGKWPQVRLEKTISMELPVSKNAVRFETEVLDLFSGDRKRL